MAVTKILRSLMPAYDSIFLSPHFDDVALSCGGTVHQQCRSGACVLVVTLFAAPARTGEPLSPLARRMHEHMGNPADMVGTRRREDRAAMAVLGAESLWLPFEDAIYRGRGAARQWRYRNVRALFGALHAEDAALVEDIAAAMAARVGSERDATYYAPLAIGNHVDHQIARRVGEHLHAQGCTVFFYEDYPYAEPGYVQLNVGQPAYSLEAVASDARWVPHMRSLSEQDLQARIKSVQAYASQLEVVFGETTKIERRIRAYATSLPGDGPMERFWRRA